MMRVIVLHHCTEFEVRRSPLRMIWRFFCISVNRPRDVDLWLFNL